MAKQVNVTIEFIGGNLEGIRYETKMSADAAVVGRKVLKPVGGSPYKVVAVHTA